MEGFDREVRTVKPSIIERLTPIIKQVVHDGAAVQLHANGVKDETHVDGEIFGGVLDDLERMGMLINWHRRVDHGIDRHGG